MIKTRDGEIVTFNAMTIVEFDVDGMHVELKYENNDDEQHVVDVYVDGNKIRLPETLTPIMYEGESYEDLVLTIVQWNDMWGMLYPDFPEVFYERTGKRI